MMPKENIYNVEDVLNNLEPPVLILSTKVGKGMYSIGHAVEERLCDRAGVWHFPVEDFLPKRAFNEDFKRYKFISNHLTWLLYLIYSIPFFYYRKYLREKLIKKNDLGALKEKIENLCVKTVICVSHRAAFWASSLKRKEKMDFLIYDILAEYGNNYGYKYIFWEAINGFLTPVKKEGLNFKIPLHVKCFNIHLPAQKQYYAISGSKGERDNVLLVSGLWGQGDLGRIAKTLSKSIPSLRISIICGKNEKIYNRLLNKNKDDSNIKIYGEVDSLLPFFEKSASIITKPGISTLVEAHAANKKIFLLKGMPVAETNNARFAIRNFGAEWFNIKRFKKWYMT